MHVIYGGILKVWRIRRVITPWIPFFFHGAKHVSFRVEGVWCLDCHFPLLTIWMAVSWQWCNHSLSIEVRKMSCKLLSLIDAVALYLLGVLGTCHSSIPGKKRRKFPNGTFLEKFTSLWLIRNSLSQPKSNDSLSFSILNTIKLCRVLVSVFVLDSVPCY